ncbi:prolyl oligopeptidase family serine peptidase [Streptomyces mobaraensis]|uniref:prolyl oligopeptidase family serine peptidase n=1 Tax=Streptomyces mobaraensis TaxID=35621 RepID=UPI003319866D
MTDEESHRTRPLGYPDAPRLPTAAGCPPDPYRWLEEMDNPDTRHWLARQQTLLALHLPDDATGWEKVLTQVEREAEGRLAAPPVEAGGLRFEQRKYASGHVITARRANGRSRDVLGLVTNTSGARISHWLPAPRGDLLAVQLHREGRESGGLEVISTVDPGKRRCLPDAAPYSAPCFTTDRMVYLSGTRAEQTLSALPLHGGPCGTVRLPVAGPVRLSLRTAPSGHLLLHSRFPDHRPSEWWIGAWNGFGAPDWQRLDLAGLGISGVELTDERLYVSADGGVHDLDLDALARGHRTALRHLVRRPSAPDDDAEVAVHALRVLPSPTGVRLAVVWRTGTTRRLELRPVQAPNTVEYALDWPAKFTLGPACHDEEGHIADALWCLADDPHHGPWAHRLGAGRRQDEVVTRRAALRTTTARSEDGAAVPVTICDPAPHVRAPLPVLVTVYGGFGIPLEPSWDPLSAAWLRAGGRLAWVHARGGGERGPDWAAAGRGAGKRLTVADLRAAAHMLVARGEARSGQLAALGASNGGLVVAAAVNQSPGLFAAVVCAAPVTDMARYTIGGLGTRWLSEYGDPREPDTLADLLEYSPYHRVREGGRYPAALLVSGGNDERVLPWHAWKLCAAWQHATRSAHPVLLDHHDRSGHHGRTAADGQALVRRALSFLARHTGLEPVESQWLENRRT